MAFEDKIEGTPCTKVMPCLKEVTRSDVAPLFKAPAYFQGKEIEVELEMYRGKWMILFFYSSDFTFV